MKEKLLKLINDFGPITSTELVIEYSTWEKNENENEFDFSNIVNELVKNGDILEVEYILPYMGQRTSMYFPKNTQIEISKF